MSTQSMSVSSCPASGISFACVSLGSGIALRTTYNSSSQTSGGFTSAEACEQARQKLEASL
jgi:hypothetical protein